MTAKRKNAGTTNMCHMHSVTPSLSRLSAAHVTRARISRSITPRAPTRLKENRTTAEIKNRKTKSDKALIPLFFSLHHF